MSISIRTLILIPIFLIVTWPVTSRSILRPEQTFYPQLRTPPGVDVAKALYEFEGILLGKGFRVTQHVYAGARYVFEFETATDFDGKMVLRYESQSKVLVFEIARFRSRASRDEFRFRQLTEDLLTAVIRDIKGRL